MIREDHIEESELAKTNISLKVTNALGLLSHPKMCLPQVQQSHIQAESVKIKLYWRKPLPL